MAADDSILLTVRQNVDVYEDDDNFDAILITKINSIFGILYQLGIGPDTGFRIESDAETWSQFTQNETRLDMVKGYMCDKVKMDFDPPQSSVLKEALAANIAEYEWRLSVMPDFIAH